MASAQENQATSLQDLALSLLQYTPNVAFYEDRAIVLEVSASLSLFHGPRHLWRRILASTINMKLAAQAGMAPTATGAWLLARQTHTRQRRALKHKTLACRLHSLPLSLLTAAHPYLDWLHGIGCLTLAQLRHLPRAGLQQRSSPLLVQALDAAYGDTQQHFAWFTAPERFLQRHELTERLEHIGPILAVCKRLLEQLCGWLQARQLAACTLSLRLHHEKGRHAQPPATINLRLSESAWLAADFLTVLGEQLQNLTLNDGVIAIDLAVSQPLSKPAASTSLFPEPAHWLRQEHRLLDLLQARLGSDRVLQAQPVADYRPEQANQWKAATAMQQATAPPSLSTTSRPFWLLPVALMLEIRQNKLYYQGNPLQLIQGPERLESGWWHDTGPEKRDYFIAQSQSGARYWVYRQRESMDSAWLLQGFFA
ncbi:DNA polymerase Y family protein [Alcaligenaceae bacterium]|nr:DNA polymerase Y family protein [Alcaligenaceae bacterium]